MTDRIKNRLSNTNIDFMGIYFFIMIVVNNILEKDKSLYVIPKAFVFLFFFMMTIFIILNIKNKQQLICKNLIFPVAFFSWETLSLLWSADKPYSVFIWETQAQLFLLFLFVYYYMRTMGSVKTFLAATYVSGYALLLYTIYRYGLSAIFNALSSSARLGGEINNENAFGMVFASAVLVAFYWITQKKSKIHFVSVIIFTFMALTSGSKKAVVIIVAGIVGISVLAYGIKRIWKTLLILLLLFAVCVFAINSGVFPSAISRIISFFNGETTNSDLVRKMLRETGFDLISKRPLCGYGVGAYAAISGHAVYSHDNFIEVCVGSGIIGLILYYVPWLRSAVFMFKESLAKRSECLILFILIMLNIVMGVGFVQVDGRSVWILLAVSLAVIDKVKSGNFDTLQ